MKLVGKVVVGGIVGITSVFGAIFCRDYNSKKKQKARANKPIVVTKVETSNEVKAMPKDIEVEIIDDVEIPKSVIEQSQNKVDVELAFWNNSVIQDSLTADPLPYVLCEGNPESPVEAMRNQHFRVLGADYLRQAYLLPTEGLKEEQLTSIQMDFGKHIFEICKLKETEPESVDNILKGMEKYCRAMGVEFGESYDEGSVLLTYMYVLLRYSQVQFGEGYRMPPYKGVMGKLCKEFGEIYGCMVPAVAYALYIYLNLINEGKICANQFEIFDKSLRQILDVGDV